MLTNQKEIRAAFWNSALNNEFGDLNVTRRRLPDHGGHGTMHNTDTRCAFVDYVDMLARDGQITEDMAQKVTL